MPLLIHAVLCVQVHGQTMQLSREAHRKISDVDALDHLTNAFREDRPFEMTSRPEILFVLSKRCRCDEQFPSLGVEAFATLARPGQRWTKAS